MNGCTAETEGCERWAPNLYLHPNQRRQAREDGKKTDGYVWREKTVFQIHIVSKLFPKKQAWEGGNKKTNRYVPKKTVFQVLFLNLHNATFGKDERKQHSPIKWN